MDSINGKSYQLNNGMTIQQVNNTIDSIVQRYGIEFYERTNKVKYGKTKFVDVTFKFLIVEDE